MRKIEKNGFGLVGIIVIIAAVAVLGGGYWYWQALKKNRILLEQKTKIQAGNEVTPTKNGIEDWKTYRNEQYGFEFQYPTFFDNVKTSSEGCLQQFVFYEGSRPTSVEGDRDLLLCVADTKRLLGIQAPDLQKFVLARHTLQRSKDFQYGKLDNGLLFGEAQATNDSPRHNLKIQTPSENIIEFSSHREIILGIDLLEKIKISFNAF